MRAAVLGFALVAATAGFGWATPTAAHAAGCTTPQVAVLVDLSHWGGSDRVGCVDWTSSLTGYQALHSAGFSTTGTVHDGPGFVCRIDGYPSAGAPDHEACVSTPPSTKYWSYWHADSGHSSWTYSTLGAASYHPHTGSVDAWTFGAGAAPSVSPSAVLPGSAPGPTTHSSTSTSTSAPTTHRSTTRSTARSTTRSTTTPRGQSASTKTHSRPAGATGAGSPAPGATTSSDSTVAASTSTSSAVTTSAPAGTSVPSSPDGSGAVTIAIGQTPVIVANSSSAGASSAGASGSAGPTIAGVVVVAVLAAGGGFYAWRRRESRSHT